MKRIKDGKPFLLFGSGISVSNSKAFITSIICFITGVIALILSVFYFIGSRLGFVPMDSFIFTAIMTVIFLSGWIISRMKFWKVASFLPPLIIFITAFYGNWIGGPSAPSIALYAVSIILTALLIDEYFQFIIMLACVISYSLLYWSFITGIIPAVRNMEETYLNRIIIVIGAFVTSSLLLWFLVSQFKKTLAKSDEYLKKVVLQGEEIKAAKGRLEKEIEERKTLEAEKEIVQSQLQQIQKMDAIGKLAGGIAHDFNNNLTSIMGYADLVLMRLKMDDPVIDQIKEIKKAAIKSSILTRQLLEFSRNQVVHPVLLDLNNLIREHEKMLGHFISNKIRISLQLDENINRILADSSQIEQILICLTVNAGDAMPDGGLLIVETKRVHLNEMETEGRIDAVPGNYIMVSVTDNGKGMDEETRSHLFEPFYTTKDLGKRSGMGLATVYGIVKQSKGHIRVWSEKDKGTTVQMYFPEREQEQTVSEKEKIISRSIEGEETILVVEDEVSIRIFVKTILTDKGYSVFDAGEAEEACKIWDQYWEKIDLLIIDMVLPGETSGMGLAEMFLKKRPDIKILYMSGYDNPLLKNSEMFKQGIHFIQKPFTVDPFLQIVREVLQ